VLRNAVWTYGRATSFARPLPDFLILGAQTRASALREEQSDKARRLNRLADRIRNREGFDVDLEAAEEVRRTGWARPL